MSRLPNAQKVHGGRTKLILKRALGSVLPAEIRERPRKGFGIPIGAWFRDGDLAWGAPHAALSATLPFRSDRLAEHRAGKAEHRLYLFSHWLLGEWLNTHHPSE